MLISNSEYIFSGFRQAERVVLYGLSVLSTKHADRLLQRADFETIEMRRMQLRSMVCDILFKVSLNINKTRATGI